MKWYLRVIGLAVLLFVFNLLWEFRSHWVYENSLDSVFLTWEDFDDAGGPGYREALTAAQKESFDFKFPRPPSEHPSNLIPPIIHFIWFKDLYGPVSGSATTSIPHEGSDAPEWCRKHNPEFTVNVWNATMARDLLEEYYAWFLPTYDGYRHPIQRVDAIKYFILWHYGGVYLDLDVSCRKKMDPLINNPAWFPRASPMGVNNDVMASRAGHPLMWKMVDGLMPRDKNLIFPWVTIFWTTGPKFTSDMLQGYLYEHGVYGANGGKERFKKDKDPNAVYVLPREFYSEEFTFFGHSPGGTWHGADVAVVLWLVNRPYVLYMLIAFVVMTVFLFSARKSRMRLLRAISNMRGQNKRTKRGDEDVPLV